MLCAKHGNKRAQTGDFSSPLPHFAHDDRSETSTFTQSALRARTYARLSWFSFFRLHPFTLPLQITLNQRTTGEDFIIFSFTSFFFERQNHK